METVLILEILNLPVIDSVKYYMCEKIKQLTSTKYFLFIEGTIGAGKSTLIKKYFYNLIGYYEAEKWKGVKVILTITLPEVTITKRMEKDLQNFYNKKITT